MARRSPKELCSFYSQPRLRQLQKLIVYFLKILLEIERKNAILCFSMHRKKVKPQGGKKKELHKRNSVPNVLYSLPSSGQAPSLLREVAPDCPAVPSPSPISTAVILTCVFIYGVMDTL